MSEEDNNYIQIEGEEEGEEDENQVSFKKIKNLIDIYRKDELNLI